MYNSTVDVGGNDLFLAKEIQSYSNLTSVIDPVCKNLNGKTVEDIYIIGDFVADKLKESKDKKVEEPCGK